MAPTVVVVSRRDVVANPRVRASVASLRAAGHEVRVVVPGRPVRHEEGVVRVASRRPDGLGVIGMLLRRLQPRRVRAQVLDRALAVAAADVGAGIVVPGRPDDTDLARMVADRVGGAVMRPFGWPSGGPRDLIDLAPDRPDLAVSPAGPGMAWFTPDDNRAPWYPLPARHVGTSIVVAYSGASTSPGAYLVRAFEDAGVDVHVVTEVIDWRTVPDAAAACVIVESPYPAFDLLGENPGIPVLFWVHHGEHHLAANLRLAPRYGADAILLAHSWHLAPWFGVPVHRFPFATAPWLVDAGADWLDRTYDVAMVGAGVAEASPVYPRRAQLVASLRTTLGDDRVAFRSGIPPEEMLATYASSRIVINDGGVRHAPITMRVFEAIGSGAALATDPIPGLERLFAPGMFTRMGDDGAGTVLDMLAAPAETAARAAAAAAWAEGRHTYAHRVDEILEIAARTPRRATQAPIAVRPFVAAIDEDVETQRIAAFDAADLVDELPTREVVVDVGRLERLGEASIDAVAVGPTRLDDAASLAMRARRYAYIDGALPTIGSELETLGRTAEVSIVGDVTRIDFHAPGYRRDQLVEGPS